VFNDALFNHPHLPGFTGWVMKSMGSTGGPRITGLTSIFGVSDRNALSAHVRKLAATPHLAFAVPGHGAVIEGDVSASLTQFSAG
jgi:azurin